MFPEIPSRIPTSIGRVVIVLRDIPARGDEPAVKDVIYDIDVLDQEGRKMFAPRDSGDMIPLLTTDEKNWLMAFVAKYRAKAESEFLP